MQRHIAWQMLPLLILSACRPPCQSFESFCEEERVVQCINGKEERTRCDAGCDESIGFCAVCGDGFLSPGEACDDGDQDDTDACRGCHLVGTSLCGDGVLSPDELCDDGNLRDGDGCESDCTHCGDGVVDNTEACDDQNHVGGDGCVSDCSRVEVCGDGVISAGDLCYAPSLSLPFRDVPLSGLASIAASDINSDGAADLIVVDFNIAGVALYLGNGDGSFQPQQFLATTDAPRVLLVDDFTGDGKKDIIIFRISFLDLFVGNGDGSFQPQISSTANDILDEFADFDNDSDLDLVSGFSDFRVLSNNGDGTFTEQPSSPGSGQFFDTTIADLNQDGNPDLIVSNFPGFTAGGEVFLGNGDGTFQPQQPLDTGSGHLAVGDINGDDIPDLLSANNFSVQSLLFIGQGDGTFEEPIIFPNGSLRPQDIALDDFDQDGTLDLVVANVFTGSSPIDDIGILLNAGSGSFQSPVIYPMGNFPAALVVSDLNNDGVPDVATVNSQSKDVSVLLSNP